MTYNYFYKKKIGRKRLTKQFRKGNPEELTNKYIYRFLTTPAIREVQIKRTVRKHSVPIDWQKLLTLVK